MKWVAIVSVVLLLSACLSLETNNAKEEIELILIPNVQPGKLETKFDIILKSENFISNPSGYIKSTSSSQLLTFTPLETPLSKTWMATATIIPIDAVSIDNIEYYLYGYLKRKEKERLFRADSSIKPNVTVNSTCTTPTSTETTFTDVYVLVKSDMTITGVVGYIEDINGIYRLDFKSSESASLGTIWFANTRVPVNYNHEATAVIEYYVFKKYAYVKEVKTSTFTVPGVPK